MNVLPCLDALSNSAIFDFDDFDDMGRMLALEQNSTASPQSSKLEWELHAQHQ